MSVAGYIRENLASPINLGFLSLLLMPAVFICAYALSFYANSNLIFYLGIFICGILFIYPLRLLIAFYLLWTNPKKYKEYEMKQLRKQAEEEKTEEKR